ncbi:hypothetical protein [Nostoc edaphicum]|nr:hypothetical protein [Nostoc edaphicum]
MASCDRLTLTEVSTIQYMYWQQIEDTLLLTIAEIKQRQQQS